jgi:hypothetical protein
MHWFQAGKFIEKGLLKKNKAQLATKIIYNLEVAGMWK